MSKSILSTRIAFSLDSILPLPLIELLAIDLLLFVKHYVSRMKTASVRELRQNFGGLLAWLEEGQEIQITMRRRVVARLVSVRPKSTPRVRMPDFAARLKKIHGDKVLSAEEAETILAENKGRY